MKNLTICDQPIYKPPSLEVLMIFKSVQILDLHNTKLNECQEFMQRIVSTMELLRGINLSQNKIPDIEYVRVLGQLEYLENLDLRENPVSRQLTRSAILEVLLFPDRLTSKTQHQKVLTASYQYIPPDSVLQATMTMKSHKQKLEENKLVKDVINPPPAPRKGPFPCLLILNGERLSRKEVDDANLYDINYMEPFIKSHTPVSTFVKPETYIKGGYVKSRNWKKDRTALLKRYRGWKVQNNNRSHYSCNNKLCRYESTPVIPVNTITLAADEIMEKEVREKGILEILKEADEKSDFDQEEVERHLQDIQDILAMRKKESSDEEDEYATLKDVNNDRASPIEEEKQVNVQISPQRSVSDAGEQTDQSEEESQQQTQKEEIQEQKKSSSTALRILRGEAIDKESVYGDYELAPVMQRRRHNQQKTKDIFDLVNKPEYSMRNRDFAMKEPEKNNVFKVMAGRASSIGNFGFRASIDQPMESKLGAEQGLPLIGTSKKPAPLSSFKAVQKPRTVKTVPAQSAQKVQLQKELEASEERKTNKQLQDPSAQVWQNKNYFIADLVPGDEAGTNGE